MLIPIFLLQEMIHMKEKTSRQIADLEGIAQAHYSRANRLSDELSYMRTEYLEVKRQVSFIDTL